MRPERRIGPGFMPRGSGSWKSTPQRASVARTRRAAITKKLAGEAEWREPVKEENRSSTQPNKE